MRWSSFFNNGEGREHGCPNDFLQGLMLMNIFATPPHKYTACGRPVRCIAAELSDGAYACYRVAHGTRQNNKGLQPISGGYQKKLSLQGERESFFDKFPIQPNETTYTTAVTEKEKPASLVPPFPKNITLALCPKEMWDERNWCAMIGGNERGW